MTLHSRARLRAATHSRANLSKASAKEAAPLRATAGADSPSSGTSGPVALLLLKNKTKTLGIRNFNVLARIIHTQSKFNKKTEENTLSKT